MNTFLTASGAPTVPPSDPPADAASAVQRVLRRLAAGVNQRLAWLVACCAVLVVAVGGFAWRQMGHVSDLAVDLGRNALPGVQRALETRLHVVQFRAAELRLLSEPNNRDAVLAELAAARALVDADPPRLRALPMSQAQAAALERFTGTWAAYLQGHARAVDLVQRREWDDAWTLLTGDSQRQQEAMHQALLDLSDRKAGQADENVDAILHAREVSRRVTLAGGLLGLLAMMAVAAWLARSVTVPLRQALAVASAVAEGDLAHPVRPSGPTEIRELLERLKRMQTSLRTLVGAAHDGAGRIRASCDGAAQANDELSQRTVRQAAAVQGIVQPMAGFGAAVLRNTESAHQATQQVEEATEVARRGGAAVQRVVDTMREIDAASRRIATIVDLTADIAFQTDLLALNAAVEAARAAGQGRSFAVVAQEMRRLAGRSAEAAREIARLIASNVEKVDAGAVEVRHAGATMDEIVAHVTQVAGRMQHITQASLDQKDGIAEVQAAVHALQALTDDNVGLVADNRARAQALQSQSASLEATVAVFRLGA